MTQEVGAKTTAAEIEEGGAMGVLVQLAKVLAVDHAAQGIRANTISPGAIETRRILRRGGRTWTRRAR